MSEKNLFKEGGGAAAFLILVVMIFTAGWTSVDQTDRCFQMRYGQIMNDNVEPGLSPNWWVYDFECVPMTDQQIPEPNNEGAEQWLRVDFETADRMNLTVPIRAVIAYDPGEISEVFVAKRSQDAIISDVKSGLVTGTAQAGNSMTLNDIFDNGGLERLEAAVKERVQEVIGRLAEVKTVYVQMPAMPQQIREQRLAAREQEERARTIEFQFKADSINGETQKLNALLAADATRLRAQAYADSVQATMEAETAAFRQSQALAELRAVEAQAAALAELLKNCTSNCIVGADVLTGALSALGSGGR